MFEQNTVCVLTPPGRGALAVVQVTGPSAAATLRAYLSSSSGRALGWLDRDEPITAADESMRSPPRPRYARWQHATGSEDVVVAQYGPDHFDLCTHGGVWASELVCEQLVSRGFRRQTWEEFLAETQPNRWLVSAQRAALDARTWQAARWLLQNAHELPPWVANLTQRLQHGETASVLRDLEAWLLRRKWGAQLRQGWHIVIAGRPNVGKSTLFNRILGFERTIVLDQPGSTRDLVGEATAVAGWPVTLFDTAGLRETNDAIEQQGVVRAERAVQQADLVVLVSDRSQAWQADEADWLAVEPAPLLVHNKADLPSGGPRPPGLEVSLVERTPVEAVLREIAARLFADRSHFAPFPTDAWQVELMSDVSELIRAGRGLSALGILRRSLGIA